MLYSASNILAKARRYYVRRGGKNKSQRFGRWWKQGGRHRAKHPYVQPDRQYYREVYLQSDHWRELRARKLRLSPCCEVCGARYGLDVHHKEYRNLYDVRLDDLQTLCRGHHVQVHARIKQAREAEKERSKPWKFKPGSRESGIGVQRGTMSKLDRILSKTGHMTKRERGLQRRFQQLLNKRNNFRRGSNSISQNASLPTKMLGMRAPPTAPILGSAPACAAEPPKLSMPGAAPGLPAI